MVEKKKITLNLIPAFRFEQKAFYDERWRLVCGSLDRHGISSRSCADHMKMIIRPEVFEVHDWIEGKVEPLPDFHGLFGEKDDNGAIRRYRKAVASNPDKPEYYCEIPLRNQYLSVFADALYALDSVLTA